MGTQRDNNQDKILEEALKKFVDAHLAERQPDIDEFVRQYPECEDQLRERILDLQKINTLFDSIVQTDESDFGDAATEQDLSGQKIGSFGPGGHGSSPSGP
jgi:hypothetical protein